MNSNQVSPKYLPGIVHCLITSLALVYLAQTDAAELLSEQFILQQLAQAQVEPDHRVTIDIKQPPEVVYDAMLNRMHEYTEDVAAIAFNPATATSAIGPDVGSERISTMEDGTTLVQRLLLVNPPETFAYFTDMSKSSVSAPIRYSIGHYVFSRLEDGTTRAQISVVYEPSSRLTAFLVRLAFRRALERDFNNAASYLETRYQP